MEGKCMRCGKLEPQPGQKCAAKNAKCKECHKIGHFHKVCQSKKRGRRANLVQTSSQSEQDTHIDENGVRQPNPLGETPQISNQCRPQRTLQAPSSGKSRHRS